MTRLVIVIIAKTYLVIVMAPLVTGYCGDQPGGSDDTPVDDCDDSPGDHDDTPATGAFCDSPGGFCTGSSP